MAETFEYHPWSVRDLVAGVSDGRVRLPDIQRPFVWANAKVRDLVDSMYRGFPVGQLMFWENRGGEHTRSIGLDDKTQTSSMQVVDGQQRLTSLYAVVEGRPVLRENYSQELIVISFNPLTHRFAVPDNATKRSAEWIQDIRSVFESPIDARAYYLEGLEKARGVDRLDRQTEREIEVAINKLADVLKFGFQVVQLKEDVSRETVADIFVRINSQGTPLSSADFILTWLSVFWEQGRQEIDEFARRSRFTPQEIARATGEPVRRTPKNPYLTLDASHILRVAVAVGNKRAPLGDAYNALRGRNPRTREIVPEDRERELHKLKDGQARALDPKHWDEYLKVIERAGIRTSSMVTSKNTVIYGYALWLIGRTEFHVPVDELREVMARWYFMAQITGRFSSSPETRAQEDLNRLEGLERTADAFTSVVTNQVDTTLTEDWWSVTLPESLHTSSATSPAFTAYISALTILDAEVLLSTLTVKDWIDPSRRPIKGVEKHHLFPKAHLKDHLHVTATRQINQVANQALVEWSDNIGISDIAPGEYWPHQVEEKRIGPDRLARQMWWHALPENWATMSYQDFLVARRHLMAKVTREGFLKLSDANYHPTPTFGHAVADEPTMPTLEELVQAGAIPVGAYLTPASGETDSIAEVTEDGMILLDDVEYRTPDLAAHADGAEDMDGWEYWSIALDEPRLLAEVRSDVTAAAAR